MRLSPFSILFLVAAAAGLFFAGFSTHDFVQHLDRQVHDIHCSFVPGITDAQADPESGCALTLMSPYSSVMRKAVWGGIPVSLAAMSVFAYLLFRGLDLVVNQRLRSQTATVYLVAATGLPVLTSLGMGYLSLVELDAACKLCIGIYASSALAMVGAIGMWRQSMGPLDDGENPVDETVEPIAHHGMAFAQGVGFVAVPVALYLALMPSYDKYVGTCGVLEKPDDKYGIMVPLDNNPGGKAAIEVFDPLCPACKGFEKRLFASGLAGQVNRKAVLFPLDDTCNWMVKGQLHPGACAVSEAILCAAEKGNGKAVIEWGFEHQEEVRAAAKSSPTGAAELLKGAFPDLASCIGSKVIQNKLNRSLRWAVDNNLPVLTPQFYVENQRMCDEDTDLGLDFALSRMLAGKKEAP